MTIAREDTTVYKVLSGYSAEAAGLSYWMQEVQPARLEVKVAERRWRIQQPHTLRLLRVFFSTLVR